MIKKLEIRNFKAIETARLKLTPLTAFIGYNGVGKSSLLEALETFQSIFINGLDKAIQQWRSYDHIYYKGKKKKNKYKKDGIEFQYAPIKFTFDVKLKTQNPLNPLMFSTSIAQEKSSSGLVYFIEEQVKYKLFDRSRDADSHYITQGRLAPWDSPDQSILIAEPETRKYVESWQFLSMNTFLMGNPFPQKRTGGKIILNKDGSNIAEYVLSIRDSNPETFNGIIETIQYVLPYAVDIQPTITQELEKMVYLQLSEQDFKVPGWLLSTGTLKILALLAVFRHPNQSPLIIIEELENGLDPRSIHLIINEIREYIKDEAKQVIITTHSPYLLDLLQLSQIVFVDRKDGSVVFNRPYDSEQLKDWAKDYKYTVGEMYTKELIQRFS